MATPAARDSLNSPDVEAILKARDPNAPLPASELYLKNLLHRRGRIQLIDDRIYEGNFHCFDSSGNIILSEVIFIRPDDSRVRFPQILAGGKFIKQIWILQEEGENKEEQTLVDNNTTESNGERKG